MAHSRGEYEIGRVNAKLTRLEIDFSLGNAKCASHYVSRCFIRCFKETERGGGTLSKVLPSDQPLPTAASIAT